MPHEDAGPHHAAEGDVMFDHHRKLRMIRQLHRQGRAAEREYYICSIPDAGERARVRRELGVRVKSAAGRAVFLITVECLRADHLSCNGHPRATTPAIDALAAGGVDFPRVYATAGDTAQSMPGLLASTLYQNFGRSRLIPPGLPTLAEALSQAGFHTIGFVAGQAQASRFYGYGRGFDEFTDFIVPQECPRGLFVDHTYRRLDAVTDQEMASVLDDCRRHPEVIKMLSELTDLHGSELVCRIAMCKRFYPYEAADLARCALHSLLEDRDARDRFYWLHLMDVHENITVPWSPLGAFTPVEQFLLNQCVTSVAGRRVLGAHSEKYRQLYDSAVAYVDAHVRILTNMLVDLGLYERSLVCVTADHGQELLERGVFGHALDRMAQGLVHVPLVFGGGLAAALSGQAAERPVSTLDVAPTILDLCGVAAPATFLGTTLNDTAQRPVCGQAFYDGAENLASDAERLWRMEPFDAPVRECAKEMHYGIEGGWQLVRDCGRGTTELNRLGPGLPPDADELACRTERWLRGAYAPPAEARCAG